nr:classA_beta_lactamase [uncultured bacterium]
MQTPNIFKLSFSIANCSHSLGHLFMLRLLSPILIFILFLAPAISEAQLKSLAPSLLALQKESGGILGVSIQNMETGDTISLNGEKPLVMQSSFKFPIALAVFNEIENNRLSLEKKVKITKSKLPKETWSPLRDQLKENTSEVSVRELLVFMVSHSDNIACDYLLDIIGGPSTVQNFIHQKGIKNIAIKYSEAEMGKTWEAQYQNWVHPKAMSDLFIKLFHEELLSPEHTKHLIKLMEETTTGAGRLKGLLPENTIVAHRTGTSGRNKDGMIAAVVDAGVLFLPNGQHAAISVFVTGSGKETPEIEAVIAKIGRAVWDLYVK